MRFPRPLAALAALFLVGGFALGAQPKIVGADDPVPPGELISLSVSPPPEQEGLLKTSYDWKVFEWVRPQDGKGYFREKRTAVDARGGVFLGSGITAKKLLAVVAVTYVYEVKGGDGKVKSVDTKTFLLNAVITVQGPEGPPTPPVPPPTGPVTPPTDPVTPPPAGPPALPDGKFKAAKPAYERATAVEAGARGKAKDLAVAFRGVAGLIKKDKDGLRGVKNILGAAGTSVDAALGDKADAWEAWGDWLQEALITLYENGTFKSDADFATYFEEISAGLEAVK